MHDLTAIYWIKNETRYLPEFIEFHLIQGYDHFIFYDNNSTDAFLDVIEPYVSDNIVEVRYYPEGDLPVRQGPPGSKNFWLMEHCIKEQRGKSKWIHFHAPDERLFCPDGRKVPDALKEYEQYGGVAVPWILFTSNGHVSRPEGLITDNFTQAFVDPDRHVKTIIDPIKAEVTCGNPHNFWYNGRNYTVDEDHQIVPDAFVDGRHQYDKKFSLYHYTVMSREEFEEKMNKGVLDWKETENVRRSYAEELWPKLNFGYGAVTGIKAQLYTNNVLCKFSDEIKENLRKRYTGKEHLMVHFNH